MDANAMHVTAYRRYLRGDPPRSERTVQNYLEAIALLVAFTGDRDLAELERGDLQDFMADLVTRPRRHRVGQLPGHVPSTAGNRFRALRAFYNWMAAEERVTASPMAAMREPKATDAPVPVVPDDQLKALLKAAGGKSFEDRRDTVIIRLFCEPGSPRVSEMAGLLLDSVDLNRDQIAVLGKGNKTRVIPFGPRTGQAIDRYLRLRRQHPESRLVYLLLGLRGQLTASGIEQMLRRRCREVGLAHIHPHQLRHTAASDWFDQGGSTLDAKELFGWSSDEMPGRYGAAARNERALRAARRTTRADRL